MTQRTFVLKLLYWIRFALKVLHWISEELRQPATKQFICWAGLVFVVGVAVMIAAFPLIR